MQEVDKAIAQLIERLGDMTVSTLEEQRILARIEVLKGMAQ